MGKKRIAARWLGAACLGAALSAGASAAPAAAAMPARKLNVDLHHVALDLRFDWAARQAVGLTTLTLAPREATDRVALDAGRLVIDSITGPGGQALAWDYDGGDRDEGLVVHLARRVAARERITLHIAYRTKWVNHSDPNNLWGSNGQGLRFFAPSSAEPRRRVQLWASGEPGANRFWFPGIDAPNALRTSELRATVPAPLRVVAGGRLVGVRDNADGTRTFHWKTEQHEPSHRTTLVVGDFTEVPQRAGRVALRSLGYPDEVDGVRASVEQLPHTLRFLEQITGRQYPHAAYTQVFVQDLPWNTVGTAFAVQTENMVDDLHTHADFQYLWDGLQTESLAQQWLGGVVPVCDWPHVWLERAFAHHLAALFTEQRHGRDEYLLWYVMANQAATVGDWVQGARNPVVDFKVSGTKDLAGFVTGNAPYQRGAAVLHALRSHLGDAAWRAVIRHYAKARAGRLSCTDDLRRSVQAVTGQPLHWFFEQWVYGAGHPVFEVNQQWSEAEHRLTLVVKQVQKGDAAAEPRQVAWFQGPVDIEIDARVHRVWLAPQAENRFSFPLGAAPGHVHFDRGDAWIKELKFEKPTAELLHHFLHTTDAAGRQWAMTQLVKRAKAKEGGLSAAERGQVQAALVSVATRDAAATYWRVRANALQQLSQLLTPAQPEDAVALDGPTTEALLRLVHAGSGTGGRSWVRTGAVRVLGLTRDPRHAELYLGLLADDSDRVVNAAAIALGKSHSPRAFDALMALPARPSWKNQSLISALNGLKELGDPRGAELALKAIGDQTAARWTLATPVWDFRLAAADTLVALKRADAPVPMLLERFEKSLAEGEVNDTFSHVLTLVTLGDARAQAVFEPLKRRFAADENALKAVADFEAQLAEKLKPR